MFSSSERIVRHIYSPENIDKKNQLRSNFVRFRFNPYTQKQELSCNRLEIDTVDNLVYLGKNLEERLLNDKFYGFGCITVERIESNENFDIAYTPLCECHPPNLSHCDIYDNNIYDNEIDSETRLAKITNLRARFVKQWRLFEYKSDLIAETLQPLTL